MRLDTQHRVVQVEPGEVVELPVDVVNNADLIDGVSARVIGMPESAVQVEPQLLPLFPGAQGQLLVRVQVPTTLTAGSHPITVEAVSHGTAAPTQHLDLDLSVSARPAVRLHRAPHTLRSRRGARFLLEVENPGNVALEVSLSATVEDARTLARFAPRTVRVEPGVTVPAILAVKGPRMITGAEIDRPVAVALAAVRAHSIRAMVELEADLSPAPAAPAAPVEPGTPGPTEDPDHTDTETERPPDLVAQTQVVLRQRPLLSRGLLTALILLSILTLWAGVFLFGLQNVLGSDPMTKTAGPSFYAGDADSDLTQVAAARPAGTLAKTGRMPAGAGGTLTGTVTAQSNRLPVGRILVEAYRQTPTGLVAVGSAATQADGTYAIDGLFPSDYLLRFSAEGFESTWWPRAARQKGAEQIPVAASAARDGLDAQVTGLPASVSGSVEDQTLDGTVAVTVTARSLDLPTASDPTGVAARQVTTDGSYALRDLVAPATYELSFAAPGYETSTTTVTVTGGERRLQPSISPEADPGQVRGTVVDTQGQGIGGVTITTAIEGQEISVITPTVGARGVFTFDNLPTPGTYVLSFSAEGYGTASEIVDLDPTQPTAPLQVTLQEGTGSLTGTLLGPDGIGLGGATVTVGGVDAADLTSQSGGTDTPTASVVPTTTTLTDGEVGRFSIAGLAVPGEYTLTFTLEGYAPTTVPVELSADEPPPDLQVPIQTLLGGIAGTVRGPGAQPYADATVSLTDGTTSWTARTGGAGSLEGAGGFRVEGLEPGTYSVTVSAEGLEQQTAIVTVLAGLTSFQDLRLLLGGR